MTKVSFALKRTTKKKKFLAHIFLASIWVYNSLIHKELFFISPLISLSSQ
jgi:hypothetical protein